MSKLVDKLERISEGSGQPLGFGAVASRARTSPMLIIASLPEENAQLITIAAKGGADALLVTIEHVDKKNKALAQISHAKLDIPWGVSLETVTKEEIEHLIEIGCDFVIFTPAKAPAAILSEERIGKVLRIDPSLPDSLSRAINRLQVDAVLLSPSSRDESTLTVHQLMLYERLASGAGKHLLAALLPSSPTSDLESLWGLGVRGIVVDMPVEQSEKMLSQLKEAIQKLPTTRKKPKEKMRAVLPLTKGESETTPSEKPDEEEEP